MVRIPNATCKIPARKNFEPTFEQQVKMAKQLAINGENWMQYVQDPEMRRKIAEAM